MNKIELAWPEALTEGIKDIVKNALRESIHELQREAGKDFLNVKETQEFIGCSYTTLRTLEEKGLKPMMVNRRKIYSKREIVAFLEQNNERR